MKICAFAFTAVLLLLLLLMMMMIAVGPADAADESADDDAPVVGAVTHLPLPRFVSMKANTGNARRGPSLAHRVDWVFKRENMPLEITAEYGNWRRVRDIDGAGGWMHYALLSGVRTVIVQKDYAALRARPEQGAEPNAYAEQGVVAFLGQCRRDWCEITADGLKGWALRSELWGIAPDEVRD